MKWKPESKILERLFQHAGRVVCVKEFPSGGKYLGIYDGYMAGTWMTVS